MENSVEVPQKIKNRTTIWSSNPTSVCISKENEIIISKRYLHPHVHYSIIHNSQDRETTQWMQKMWYLYVYNGILSAIKKKEILLFLTKWVNLKDIMLSEISQRKVNTVWSHLFVKSKKVKLIEPESRTVVSRGWQVG